MPRINLGGPYEEYIQNQIKTGLFSSATEVIKSTLKFNEPFLKELQALPILQQGSHILLQHFHR